MKRPEQIARAYERLLPGVAFNSFAAFRAGWDARGRADARAERKRRAWPLSNRSITIRAGKK